MFFYWSPLKCLSNFFLIGPPQHCWGGPIQKNYLNILGGNGKKKHPVFILKLFPLVLFLSPDERESPYEMGEVEKKPYNPAKWRE